jgi:hypothetical protein
VSYQIVFNTNKSYRDLNTELLNNGLPLGSWMARNFFKTGHLTGESSVIVSNREFLILHYFSENPFHPISVDSRIRLFSRNTSHQAVGIERYSNR